MRILHLQAVNQTLAVNDVSAYPVAAEDASSFSAPDGSSVSYTFEQTPWAKINWITNEIQSKI